MPTLSAAANTENMALAVIKAKGYQCWYVKEHDLYYAEKGGWDLAAHGLVELLGIIGIYEHVQPDQYKDYWWRTETTWLLDDIATEPTPYNSVMRRLKTPV